MLAIMKKAVVGSTPAPASRVYFFFFFFYHVVVILNVSPAL